MRQALAATARLSGGAGAKDGGSLTLDSPVYDAGRVFDAFRTSPRVVRLLTKFREYITHTISYNHLRDYV